jgi:tetratricopeptide (TPR) repeat protein
LLHVALGRNHRAIGHRLILEGRPRDATPHFEQAIASFEEAIRLDPEDPQSYDEIGWTYGHYMGDDREAKQRGVDYLEEAIAHSPDYALAYRHLGQVYYDLRNYEETIAMLGKALEIGDLPVSDTVLTHIMLGWSHYALDRADAKEGGPCVEALPHFRAAWDVLDQLSQRELGLESLVRQGLDACQ